MSLLQALTRRLRKAPGRRLDANQQSLRSDHPATTLLSEARRLHSLRRDKARNLGRRLQLTHRQRRGYLAEGWRSFKTRAGRQPVPVIPKLAMVLEGYRASMYQLSTGVMFHHNGGESMDMEKLANG